MYVVLVYDISLDNKGNKVWKKIFQENKKYLSHVQNSVFEGEITKSQLFELTSVIRSIIRKDIDSVIIFKSRHERWLEKDIIGKKIDVLSEFI